MLGKEMWKRLSSMSRIVGIKITTIRTRLMGVHAFLCYLVEEGIVSLDVFGRRIRL